MVRRSDPIFLTQRPEKTVGLKACFIENDPKEKTEKIMLHPKAKADAVYGIRQTKSGAFCYWRFSEEENRMAFTKGQEAKRWRRS